MIEDMLCASCDQPEEPLNIVEGKLYCDECLNEEPGIELTRECMKRSVSLPQALIHLEKRILEEALKVAKGKKKAAAEYLGISFHSIRNRLRKHNIGEKSNAEL